MLPRPKAKKGIMIGMAGLRNARISWSRLPIRMPNSSGSTAPSSTGQGKDDRPATPRVTMVRNGPDSMLITE